MGVTADQNEYLEGVSNLSMLYRTQTETSSYLRTLVWFGIMHAACPLHWDACFKARSHLGTFKGHLRLLQRIL